MKATDLELPKVVTRAEWLVARQDLIAREKAATRARDALNAERRRLPMVRIETDGRGVKQLGSVSTFLDLTPYGRQEDWEDSPKGWPQMPPYTWRHHDKYELSKARE
jgi:predicted dithiol-disulfide oxidoreductase (DUF899 family)